MVSQVDLNQIASKASGSALQARRGFRRTESRWAADLCRASARHLAFPRQVFRFSRPKSCARRRRNSQIQVCPLHPAPEYPPSYQGRPKPSRKHACLKVRFWAGWSPWRRQRLPTRTLDPDQAVASGRYRQAIWHLLQQPPCQQISERCRHTFGATLNRPPKGDPDYGSRVVSEKSHDVRPSIQLTANVERE